MYRTPLLCACIINHLGAGYKSRDARQRAFTQVHPAKVQISLRICVVWSELYWAHIQIRQALYSYIFITTSKQNQIIHILIKSCSPLFVRRCFHMWRLFCHYLFLISPSFGVSGRLCFVTVVFPGYLHIFFIVWNVWISGYILEKRRSRKNMNLHHC